MFLFLLRLAGLLLMAIWPAAAQALVEGRKDSSLSDMGDTACLSRICTRAQRDAWQDTWAYLGVSASWLWAKVWTTVEADSQMAEANGQRLRWIFWEFVEGLGQLLWLPPLPLWCRGPHHPHLPRPLLTPGSPIIQTLLPTHYSCLLPDRYLFAYLNFSFIFLLHLKSFFLPFLFTASLMLPLSSFFSITSFCFLLKPEGILRIFFPL